MFASKEEFKLQMHDLYWKILLSPSGCGVFHAREIRENTRQAIYLLFQ
jgi:hypothetical protein